MINREIEKYDILHSDPGYGQGVNRYRRFFNSIDKFSSRVMSLIWTSERLLDVGCGKGEFIKTINRKYRNVETVGIDIAEFESDINYIEMSATDIKFDDKYFDLVCHQDGMEHIPVELEKVVLSELGRVSKSFIYNTLSLTPEGLDDKFQEFGLGKVHCNIKTPFEWIDFYKSLEEFEIIGIHFVDRFFSILLERIK